MIQRASRGSRSFAILFASTCLAVFLAAPPAIAQAHGEAISVTVENDALLDTDRYYTNGIRFEYARELPAGDRLARRILNRLFGPSSDADILESLAFGQTIFTPEDILTDAYLPDQRPYAGFLFLDYTINRQTQEGTDWLLLQIGLVGPSAGGEAIQNWYHSNIIDRAEAQGWDNQIDDEPGFVFAYDRQFSTINLLGDGRFGLDLTPHAGAALGTIHSDLHAGATLRLGNGLALDAGPPRIKPAVGGAGYFHRGQGFTLYGFLGGEARIVAHNIFLDGSLFRSGDPGVDSETFVYDLQAGLVAQYRDLQLSLTFVRRSEEYSLQKNPQEFTALGMAYRF